MKFMIIIKATEASEKGILPSQELLEQMTTFNEELVKAGVMVAGEGLHPSSDGARVRFEGDKRIVTDGPFAETKDLVAGFWIWKLGSLEEAIEWVKRIPNPDNEHAEVEIRQVYTDEEFAESDPTGEIREREAKIREQLASQQ